LAARWRAGDSVYAVTTRQPDLLVEMDAFVPGWRAFVDGHEQPILQANVFGRAVVVPEGTHTVAWRFAPRSAIASLLVSWTGLAISLLVFLLGAVSRQVARSRPAPRKS
jgi:uncharacterized membrane protein YfhO